MIERYQNSEIARIFSQRNTLHWWRQIELIYLQARKDQGDETVTHHVLKEVRSATMPTPEELATHERVYGHDVVAFLALWTGGMPYEAAAQVHAGLTSSDLVDNALFAQLRSATDWVHTGLNLLNDVLIKLSRTHRETVRIGRTHGQHAEPTTLGWRFSVWQGTLSHLRCEAYHAVQDALDAFKSAGAVGRPDLLGDAMSQAAGKAVTRSFIPTTQVIPRQRLITWAGWMVAVASLIEEIALEIRLSARTEVAELQEGATERRAGSSAMPHKRNPIQSERLSGLARVVRSNFGAIAETAGNLHNERDISNSSVERIVIPDTCHLAAFMLSEVIEVLNDLKVDTQWMEARVKAHDGSARQLFDLQKSGVPYMVARERLKP